MELDGLPLHPLVVHAVVVLAPLAAITALVYAAVPRWRWLLRWPMVALALGTTAAALLATASGEALLEARPELGPLVEDHQDHGELLRNWSFGFLAAAVVGAWALGGPTALRSGRGEQPTRGVLGWVAVLLLVGGAAGILVLVYLAGDTGARAVWG